MYPTETLESVLGRADDPTPPVSIIIPHYNVPKEWAHEAIASAINQNYPKGKLEVIVIDDRSDDIRHLRTIPGIRLIELEKNSGPSIARNRGVSIAEGEYIFFADADDRIHPDAVRICARNASGSTLTYSDHRKVTSDLSETIHDRKKARFHELHQEHKGTLLDPLLHTSFIGMCQFVQTEAFREIGGYDPTLKKGEDFDMLLRLSELDTDVNFNHVPITLYDYRQNRASISHDDSLRAQPYEVIRRALVRRGFTGAASVEGFMRLKPYDNTFFDIARNGRIIDIPYVDRERAALKDPSKPLKSANPYTSLWTTV